MQPTDYESTELLQYYLLLDPNLNHLDHPIHGGAATSAAALQLTGTGISTPALHHQHLHHLHAPPCGFVSACSNSTTSDEEQQQLMEMMSVVVDERKRRRMISNRESARRSRIRKQRHLDELWSQVTWLRNENHLLLDKLNQVSQRHDQAVLENSQLKDEASELRQMITQFNHHAP